MAGGLPSGMTKSGFEPNHREFGMHIRSEVARKPALMIAYEIAEVANEIAPFDADSGNTVHVKGSYKVRRAGTLKVGRNSRAIAEVYSKAPSAKWVEVIGHTGADGMKKPPRRILLRSGMRVLKRHGFNLRDARSGG